jgi:hypothetical protein
MKIRNYNHADFDMVAAWWRGHHGNDFQQGFIPPTAYIVTDDDGSPWAFFAMASLQCDICYFLYPMVNPTLDKEQRGEAIDFMINCAKIWTVNTGHKITYISIRGEKMLSRLEQNGFISGEDNCQHMFCKVEMVE